MFGIGLVELVILLALLGLVLFGAAFGMTLLWKATRSAPVQVGRVTLT